MEAPAVPVENTKLSSHYSNLKTKVFSRNKESLQRESNAVVPRRRNRLVKRQLPTTLQTQTLENEIKASEEQSSKPRDKEKSTQNTQCQKEPHDSSVPYNATGINLQAALASTPGTVLEVALDPVGEPIHDLAHESALGTVVEAPLEIPVQIPVEAITSQQTAGTTLQALPPCPPVALVVEHVPMRQKDSESQQVVEARAFEARNANETFFGIPQTPGTTIAVTHTEDAKPSTRAVDTRRTSAGPHTTDIANQTPDNVYHTLASADNHSLVRFPSLRGLGQENSAAGYDDQGSSAIHSDAIFPSSSSSVDVDSQSTQTTIDSRNARPTRTQCIGTIKKATEVRVLRSQVDDLVAKCQTLQAEKVTSDEKVEKIMYTAFIERSDLQQRLDEAIEEKEKYKAEANAKHDQLSEQFAIAERYMDQRDLARREEATRNGQLDQAGQQLHEGLQREQQQAEQIETLSKELRDKRTVAEACRQDFANRYLNRSQQCDEVSGPVRPDAQDATVRAFLHMQIMHRGLTKVHEELVEKLTKKDGMFEEVNQKATILKQENEGLKESHCQADHLHEANEQYFGLLLEAKKTGDLEMQQIVEAGNEASAKERALKQIAMNAVIEKKAAMRTMQQQTEDHKIAVQVRDATIEELKKEAIRLEAKSFAFDTDLAESQKLVAGLQEAKDDLQAFAGLSIEERIRHIVDDKDNQITNLQQMWNELNCALVNSQQLLKQSEMRVVNRKWDLERKLAFPTQMMIERDLLRLIVNATRDFVLEHPNEKVFSDSEKLKVGISHLLTVLKEKDQRRLFGYAPHWVQLVGEEQMHHVVRDEGVDPEDLEAVESAQEIQRHMQLVANYDWARERDAEDKEEYRKREDAKYLKEHDNENQKELEKREKAWKKMMQLNRKAKKEHGIDVEEDEEHPGDADAADSAEDEDDQRALRVINEDEWESTDEEYSQPTQCDQQEFQGTPAPVQRERFSDSGFLLSSSPAGAPEGTEVTEDNGEESQLSEFRFDFDNHKSDQLAARPQKVNLSEALAAEHKKGHVGRNAPWNRAFEDDSEDDVELQDECEDQCLDQNHGEEESSPVLMPAIPKAVLPTHLGQWQIHGMRQHHGLDRNEAEGGLSDTPEVPLLFAPPTMLATPRDGGRTLGEKYNGFLADDL